MEDIILYRMNGPQGKSDEEDDEEEEGWIMGDERKRIMFNHFWHL
jgi:hypothetical protein